MKTEENPKEYSWQCPMDLDNSTSKNILDMDKSTFFNPDLLLPPAHLLLHSAWHSGTVLLSNCNKLLMLDEYILKFKIHFIHLHKTFKKSVLSFAPGWGHWPQVRMIFFRSECLYPQSVWSVPTITRTRRRVHKTWLNKFESSLDFQILGRHFSSRPDWSIIECWD